MNKSAAVIGVSAVVYFLGVYALITIAVDLQEGAKALDPWLTVYGFVAAGVGGLVAAVINRIFSKPRHGNIGDIPDIIADKVANDSDGGARVDAFIIGVSCITAEGDFEFISTASHAPDSEEVHALSHALFAVSHGDSDD